MSLAQQPLVKFNPLVVLAADRAGFGGAIRLWYTARNLDAAGSSKIELAELRTYVEALGVSDRTARNWLHDGFDLGLFVKWAERPDTINLVGAEHVAAMLGIRHLDTRPATIPAKRLLCKGWRPRVWSAFIEANHQGAQIAQDILYRLTQVPVSTQRRWNVKGKVKRKRNIAILHMPADQLRGTRDFGGYASPFIVTDRRTSEERVASHIPSTNRATDRSIKLACRGRTRKINRFLASEFSRSLLKLEQAQSDDLTIPARMFCATVKQYKSALAAIRKHPDYPTRTLFIKRKPFTRYVGVWDAVPC